MTPTTLQALVPAAPPPASQRAGLAEPDAPASFAATLDASVRALPGDGAQAGTDAGELDDRPEAAALASDEPRLDALALMLAAAPALPAPPEQSPPVVAGAAAAAAAAAGVPAAGRQGAVDVFATFAGRAASLPETLPPAALAAAKAGERTRPAAAPADPPEAGAAADAVTVLPPASALAPAGGPSGIRRPDLPIAIDASRAQRATLAGDDEDGAEHVDGARTSPAVAVTPASTAGSRRGAADPVAALATALASGAAGAQPAATPRAPMPADGEAAISSATRTSDAAPAAVAEAASPTTPQAPLGTAMAALPVAAAHAAAGPVAQLAPPVGSPDWAPALAQQLVRLPGGGEVELHLNPAELGPLQVKLSMVESQAQVLFVAEHAAVRHALEAALPQLRSSLADSGISLGQATVGSGAGEQQRAGQDRGERPGRGEEAAQGEARPPAGAKGAPARSARAGAVDTFA